MSATVRKVSPPINPFMKAGCGSCCRSFYLYFAPIWRGEEEKEEMNSTVYCMADNAQHRKEDMCEQYYPRS